MKLKQYEIVSRTEYFTEPIGDILRRYKTIKKYAYILHDKDADTSPHYHIYVNFGKSGVDSKIVAQWFGVQESQVERIKGRATDMLLYLTHGQESQKNKYQYSPSEVVANFDFEAEIEKSKILGDFKKYSYAEQLKYIDTLPIAEKKTAFGTLEKLWKIHCQVLSLQPDRDIDVMFIYGMPGTGKTTYAKRFAEGRGYTFGYDYTHYRTIYKDELKITHLFEALEDYACAYLIFTVKTTLLFSNYSIRVDSILRDLGNMPSRDNDFFSREPEYQEAYSRHAHIIDIDMLRLGKKVVKDNPKARRLSYGVFVITEIDKEFKNMQELKETKINEKETNQKNDLHNACIMMSRHAAVVANRVFIRIIADLQRPEAWGAGGRELGEIIYISDKSELAPALPFFSPYWFTQGVYTWIKGWWDSFYSTYIENRSDNTLFTYLAKNITAILNNHYDKINGLLGTQTLTLEIQSGRMDGEVKKDKWRLIMKKDRSRRYKTACLEGVFDSYVPNTMHIDDFIMYAGEVGTNDENQLQNSYFQMDIAKMKLLNISENNKKTEA